MALSDEDAISLQGLASYDSLNAIECALPDDEP
jgi:hypothetical protein